jgi:hypothetical protein
MAFLEHCTVDQLQRLISLRGRSAGCRLWAWHAELELLARALDGDQALNEKAPPAGADGAQGRDEADAGGQWPQPGPPPIRTPQ